MRVECIRAGCDGYRDASGPVPTVVCPLVASKTIYFLNLDAVLIAGAELGCPILSNLLDERLASHHPSHGGETRDQPEGRP